MEDVRAITSTVGGLGLEPFLGSDPPAAPTESRRGRRDSAETAGLASDRVEISPEGLRGVRPVQEPDPGIGLPGPDARSRPARSRRSEYNKTLGTFQTTIRIGKREYQVPPEQLARFRESYGRFIRENFPHLREPRPSVGSSEPGAGSEVDEEA